MEKLCIVVIGHNDIAHLKRSLTIASREAAKCSGCSVLYTDDCSEDGSFEFAVSLAKDLGNLSVIRTTVRRNIGGVRNAAVEFINSQPDDKRPEYIWFHDSDDYITEGSVERIVSVMEEKKHPDCISIPLATYRGGSDIPKCPVMQNTIDEAPFGPVSECAYVFKTGLYVKNVENQRCEDCPWHYEQFDKFETWAKVEGDDPCYVWDNTNPSATTRTVDYCVTHSMTFMAAALSDILVKEGKLDSWVSDNLRNMANMYDVRHRLKRPAVRRAWEQRFRNEICNFLNGFHVH